MDNNSWDYPQPPRSNRPLAVWLAAILSIWGPVAAPMQGLRLALLGVPPMWLLAALLAISQFLLHRRIRQQMDEMARFALIAGYWHVGLYALVHLAPLALNTPIMKGPFATAYVLLLFVWPGLHIAVAIVAQLRVARETAHE